MQVIKGRKPNLQLVKPKQKSQIYLKGLRLLKFTQPFTRQRSLTGKIQALLTYAHDICNMAKLNYDWLGYGQFPVDRESTRCSWAEVRSDLYLIFIFHNPKPQPSTLFHLCKFDKPSQGKLISPDGSDGQVATPVHTCRLVVP